MPTPMPTPMLRDARHPQRQLQRQLQQQLQLPQKVCAVDGPVGKVACTKSFHCVRARDAAAFYRVLVQLKY